METFILQIDGIIQPKSYTSLRGLCKEYGISYSWATKGRLKWCDNGKLYTITAVTVNKILGRGTKNGPKSKANLKVGKHYEPF